jgi:hypothetical protein
MPAPVLLAAIVLAGCSIALSFSARAAPPQRTPEGIAFVAGGVGAEEVETLAAERARWPLAVRVAARRSGASLIDVHLCIRDAAGRPVFDSQLQAPWLLIDLPPGHYDIVGVHAGEVARQAVTVPVHGHRESVLYFPVAGEAAPHRAADD